LDHPRGLVKLYLGLMHDVNDHDGEMGWVTSVDKEGLDGIGGSPSSSSSSSSSSHHRSLVSSGGGEGAELCRQRDRPRTQGG
jgi:hypothetical protein